MYVDPPPNRRSPWREFALYMAAVFAWGLFLFSLGVLALFLESCTGR